MASTTAFAPIQVGRNRGSQDMRTASHPAELTSLEQPGRVPLLLSISGGARRNLRPRALPAEGAPAHRSAAAQVNDFSPGGGPGPGRSAFDCCSPLARGCLSSGCCMRSKPVANNPQRLRCSDDA
jgi:hypothetical protein